LDEIHKKLGELIPRGRLDTGKLEAGIRLKRGSATNAVELVRLKFSQASNSQTQEHHS
jgi:hypothetical protein